MILADSHEDAYKKLDLFLDRCQEFNLHLKFSKSFLGFQEVKFFGYVCDSKGYHLSEDRIAGIREMAFPTTRKGMQSFLGCALFFKSFIPNYSALTAPLTGLTSLAKRWD